MRRSVIVMLALALPALTHAQETAGEGAAAASPSAPDAPVEVIVITATRDQADPKHLPQSVSVVDRDELDRRQPRQPNQALSEEAGIWSVDVNAQGSPVIRGQIGNRVLYLWDGIRINNGALFGGPNGFMNQFPMGALDRIEVVRGPGSVEYGSDAIGGVVNLISKRRDSFSDGFEWGAHAKTIFGSVDAQRTQIADVQLTSPWVGFQGGFTGQDVNGFESASEGTQHSTGFESLGGYADLGVRLGEGQALHLSYIRNKRTDVESYVQSKLNPGGQPRLVNPLEDRAIAKVQYEGDDLASWLDNVRGYLYYQTYDQRRDRSTENTAEDGASIDNQIRRAEHDVWGAGLQASFPSAFIGEERLILGVDYRAEDLSGDTRIESRLKQTGEVTTAVPQGNTPDGRYDVTSAFARLTMQPGWWLDVSVGGRFESTHMDAAPVENDLVEPFTLEDLAVDERWNAVTWSVGAIAWVTPDLGLAANVATGFRAPTYSDALSFGVPVFSTSVASLPSPGVGPEKSITYEVGPRWVSRHVNAQVTLYDTELTDLVTNHPAGTIDVPGVGEREAQAKGNDGEGYVRGVEAAVAIRVGGDVTVFGNGTYTTGMDTQNDERLRFLPPLNGLVGARYEPAGDPYWVELVARGAARMTEHAPRDETDAGFSRDPGLGSPGESNPPYRENFEIPGYVVLNLRGGVEILRGRGATEPSARLTLDLNNILNAGYREAYSQQQLQAPGFGAVFGVDVAL